MILRKKLMRKLYQLYPYYLAKKNHDFVGVMLSTKKEEINNIVLCLDLDEEVYNLLDKDVDLIITHHPFLYGKSKVQILKNDPLKKSLYDKLSNRGIGVISMHTNFDEAKDGMNDVLSLLLNLNDVYAPNKFPMMRIGYLPNKMDIETFIKYVKEKLNVNYALLENYGKTNIEKVAIIGGGGSSYYQVALEENADIFVSSDASHHIRRDICNHHFNYLEIPHEVERVFMKKMKEVLLKIDDTLNIQIIDHEKEVKVY